MVAIPPVTLGTVHNIGLELDRNITLDSGFGEDGDIAINSPEGIIYVKILGTWTLVYPILL